LTNDFEMILLFNNMKKAIYQKSTLNLQSALLLGLLLLGHRLEIFGKI